MKTPFEVGELAGRKQYREDMNYNEVDRRRMPSTLRIKNEFEKIHGKTTHADEKLIEYACYYASGFIQGYENLFDNDWTRKALH